MIDIEKTISLRGYDPLMLTYGSSKKVWSICNSCGYSRWLSYQQYNDLCHKCGNNTKEHIKRLSKSLEGRKLSCNHCFAISKALRNRILSDEWKTKISKSHLKNGDPLPSGYKVDKNSKIATNKDCGAYLGCYVAEQILSKIFKNVKVMPYANSGYDLICDGGYKIDVKSCTTRKEGSTWQFAIGKNEIADYFLCIAFDNRDDLNPIHLWLIPGKDVNHLKYISISKKNIQKWKKYEQSLDKVIECCNNMRGN